MLYSLFEAQHTALAPWRSLAEFTRGWYGNPFSPLAHLPLSRRMAASSDLFLRLTGRYEKPQWDCGEMEVALDKPFCKLIHFKSSPEIRRKVLLVARSQATTRRCCATRCARSRPSTTYG